MMECWARSEALALSWNNGQKRITSVFGSRLLVRLWRIRINFYSFSMNVDIDARDNHPFVAIMALPNEIRKYFIGQETYKEIASCQTLSFLNPRLMFFRS
jgi:hypothetical protein